MPGERFEKSTRKQSIWLRYIQYIKTSKNALVGILVLSVLTYFFTIIFNMFIQNMIDNIGRLSYKLPWIAVGTVLGYILVVVMNALMKVFFNTKLFSDFSKTIYKHLIGIDYTFFENRSFGNLAFSLECIGMVKIFMLKNGKFCCFSRGCDNSFGIFMQIFRNYYGNKFGAINRYWYSFESTK